MIIHDKQPCSAHVPKQNVRNITSLCVFYRTYLLSTLRPAEVFVVAFWITPGAERSVHYVQQDVVRRQNQNVAEEPPRTQIRTFWVRSEFGRVKPMRNKKSFIYND